MRTKWIDIYKGIGILLVVAGHITSNEILKNNIFMFHMPLFFIISGFLFHRESSAFFIIKRKAKSLMLPYVSYLITLTIPIIAIMIILHKTDIHGALILIIKSLYGGQYLAGPTGVFWFVSCLFFTQILYNYISTKFNNTSLNIIIALFLISSYIVPAMKTPLNILACLMSIPLFHIGSLLKKHSHLITNKVALYFFTLFAICGILMNIYGFNNYFDMKYIYYGIPLLTLLFSISFCIIIVKFSMTITSPYVTDFLAALGNASLTIMFTHQSIQMILSRFSLFKYEPFKFVITIVLAYILNVIIYKFEKLRYLFCGK